MSTWRLTVPQPPSSGVRRLSACLMKHSGQCPTLRFRRARSGTASTWIGIVLSAALLDTDVLIDHLRGYRQLDLVDPTWKISVVTRCELFAGRNANEQGLRRTLNGIDELSVDRTIAESAGRIRRVTQLDIPDALIAATALEHQLPLMTRNRRHFERVAGLTLRDPFDQPDPKAVGSSPRDAAVSPNPPS
jgi:predicted nucleic acid-binding protein